MDHSTKRVSFSLMITVILNILLDEPNRISSNKYKLILTNCSHFTHLRVANCTCCKQFFLFIIEIRFYENENELKVAQADMATRRLILPRNNPLFSLRRGSLGRTMTFTIHAVWMKYRCFKWIPSARSDGDLSAVIQTLNPWEKNWKKTKKLLRGNIGITLAFTKQWKSGSDINPMDFSQQILQHQLLLFQWKQKFLS